MVTRWFQNLKLVCVSLKLLSYFSPSIHLPIHNDHLFVYPTNLYINILMTINNFFSYFCFEFFLQHIRPILTFSFRLHLFSFHLLVFFIEYPTLNSMHLRRPTYSFIIFSFFSFIAQHTCREFPLHSATHYTTCNTPFDFSIISHNWT